MKIKINGEDRDFEHSDISISQLLVMEKVSQPDMVTVQLNGAFVPRTGFESSVLKGDDEIDFLYFMGGGS